MNERIKKQVLTVVAELKLRSKDIDYLNKNRICWFIGKDNFDYVYKVLEIFILSGAVLKQSSKYYLTENWEEKIMAELDARKQEGLKLALKQINEQLEKSQDAGEIQHLEEQRQSIQYLLDNGVEDY